MIERMNEKIVWEWIRNAEKFKQIYTSILVDSFITIDACKKKSFPSISYKNYVIKFKMNVA